ncbi:hypothetical protein BKA00_005537 [Actinomadura coerulea]|uniref:Uncharacterized protein n=1 Tax=Actinomadura coerulea TaxID=46159 RepID=A0A7X0G379_9ACTN|nr:hypothetical protein [Actinomadura coerulea]
MESLSAERGRRSVPPTADDRQPTRPIQLGAAGSARAGLPGMPSRSRLQVPSDRDDQDVANVAVACRPPWKVVGNVPSDGYRPLQPLARCHRWAQICARAPVVKKRYSDSACPTLARLLALERVMGALLGQGITRRRVNANERRSTQPSEARGPPPRHRPLREVACSEKNRSDTQDDRSLRPLPAQARGDGPPWPWRTQQHRAACPRARPKPSGIPLQGAEERCRSSRQRTSRSSAGGPATTSGARAPAAAAP